jgi:hypothetical protein
VDGIRRDVLYRRRWPEMVTFEEMNTNPPAEEEKLRMLVTVFQTVSRERLISKGVNYNKKHRRTGKWPGEDDCERLNFFVNGDPDFPDLNRLFTDCVWDADTQRWERKQ